MPCTMTPNVTGLACRARCFIDYASSTRLPRIHKKLPRNPDGSLGDGWKRAAIRNAAAAATPTVNPDVHRHWDFDALELGIPEPPPTLQQETRTCIHVTYDAWHQAAIQQPAPHFDNCGQTQKFLNLLIKYNYCAERSGLGQAWGRAGWTLEYECALHAPIDRRVLTSLRSMLKGRQVWNHAQAIIMDGATVTAWTTMTCPRYLRLKQLIEALVFATWPPNNPCVAAQCGAPFAASRDELLEAVRAQVLPACMCQGTADNDPIISALDLEMRGLWSP